MEFRASLVEEDRRLTQEVEASPAFQKREMVRRLLAMYDGADGRATNSPNKVSAPRAGSMASAVLDAAEEFFTRTGRRAMAPEITAELCRAGVVPTADTGMTRTVASYLSTAKDRFNNIRGQGYGLASWPRSDRDEPEAPEEGQSDPTAVLMPDGRVLTMEEILA